MGVNKYLVIFLVIFMFIASPIAINFIVNGGPWFGIIAATDNDWISFFGDYFGGIVTALSLVITILYTTWQYKDHDRKRIQPYLTISQLHKFGPIDQTKEIKNEEYKTGLIGVLNEEIISDDQYGFFFPKVEFFGEISNIGIGTAINITLNDIEIENRGFGNITTPIRSLSVEDKTFFRINLYNIFIESNHLREEVMRSLRLKGVGPSKIPRLQINFQLHYFDMLGNGYSQDVMSEIQAVKNKDQSFRDNVLFKDITFTKQV